MLGENKTKILAFYLPQFHTFPENDEWWGKGFTEWTNVKKAKPLYKNHNQPRVPENGEYYDLKNVQVINRQMQLAKQYGIYGFCYYHYWFDGKLLLHKPLEKMLALEEEDKLAYCFCWANEPWTRAWDGSREVLMPQNYGGKDDWEKHFQYLLQFFNDNKYIKISNKPMLVLYRTNNIPDCDQMITYWDERCRNEGFAGIYIIEEKNNFQNNSACKSSSGILEFEPMYTLKYRRTFLRRIMDRIYAKIDNLINNNNLLLYKYDDVWSNIVTRNHPSVQGKTEFLGAFVDWDNTPRKGRNGLIIRGATPKKFRHYFSLQLERAEQLHSEFLFINAWNEWGEGTYLEPDKSNNYGYLEAIKDCLER